MLAARRRRGARADLRAPCSSAACLIPDCVSSFPSVTPVACSEMVTGVGADRHWISGMNWYHRLERRYVEYGSSLDATRAFGVFRALYDLVYNMNLAHLSPEVETLFEQPRRRRRAHRLHAVPDLPRPPPPPGLARRADAPRRRRDPAQVPPPHLGPDRALLRRPLRQPRGALQVDLDPRQSATPTPPAARPSWCKEDAFDFLLLSLPDNDNYSHRHGPEASVESIAKADDCFATLVEAAGGLDAFLDDARADPASPTTPRPTVDRGLPLAELLGREWSVLQPSDDRPELAQLAVSPTGRAAHVYLLPGEGERAEPAAVAARLAEIEGVDLVCWLEDADGRRCAARSRGCRRRRRVGGGRARRRAAALPARRRGRRPARRPLGARRRARRCWRRRSRTGACAARSTRTRWPGSGRR